MAGRTKAVALLNAHSQAIGCRLRRRWECKRPFYCRLLEMSLSEAARVSRQSQSTIWRAINSGRLSATRTYTGDYQIDPAGLHRFSLVKLYPMVQRPTQVVSGFSLSV